MTEWKYDTSKLKTVQPHEIYKEAAKHVTDSEDGLTEAQRLAALIAHQLERRDVAEAEVDRMHRFTHYVARDLGEVLRDLHTLMDVWGDGTGECVYRQAGEVSDNLKAIIARIGDAVPPVED